MTFTWERPEHRDCKHQSVTFVANKGTTQYGFCVKCNVLVKK